MISNASCNPHTIASPIAGTPVSTHPDAHASPSEAAEFSDQIAYREGRRIEKAEAQALSEKSDVIDDDMMDGASVSRGSDRHLTEDDKTIADINGNGGVIPVLPLPVPVPPVPASASIPAADTPLVLVIDTPAVQESSKNASNPEFPGIAPISTNKEPFNASITPVVIVGNAIEPSISFAGHGGDAGNNEATALALTTSINNTTGKGTVADNAISASQSINDAAVRPSSGDMQALVSEFETSVNHFERSGNQWVGNAKIVFQSTVLNGASVQITGDGKSLNILISQSAQSSPIALLSRQEKQLCDALTRRLGRVVTLHVQQTFETQAADDTEPPHPNGSANRHSCSTHHERSHARGMAGR